MKALEEVMDEWGWEGVSIRRISEKAGVSKVLIYRYFGGLEGLMVDYVKKGTLFPVVTSEVLDQLTALHQSDLAPVWYRHIIRTYRSFRLFKAGRALLKATLLENDLLGDAISVAMDEEMTRLVDHLSLVPRSDSQAVAAVILGGMSYLTIMAHNNHPVVGLDLRSQEDWKRIEEAIKLLSVALNDLVVASAVVTVPAQSANLPNPWL
ncbi:TetR/AcrR family transcriptional regulator [Spirosoma flavum]|uniref:TetR/AcrR family transcriptional regulator n=1 Tax=Spirosoma flavum TaxID=2048557 RepID=A0ABW6AVL4_9BACT